MGMPTIFFVGLCCVLLSNGIEVHASHRACPDLEDHMVMVEEMQFYRTSYHFQPPKNWLNGIKLGC